MENVVDFNTASRHHFEVCPHGIKHSIDFLGCQEKNIVYFVQTIMMQISYF